jgi:hypothetical protein
VGGNRLELTVALVLAGLLGGGAGFWAASIHLAEPLARLNTLTPVVVLDRAAVLRALPPTASADMIQQTLATLRASADRLAAAGYVVLDAGSVVAAPEDSHVRPER